MADRRDPQRSSRSAQDRSIVLLLIGLVLLMPPLGAAFLLDGQLASLPISLLYVFAVWLGLIVGTAMLSGRLWRSIKTTDADDEA